MKRVTTGLAGLGLVASLGLAYTAPSAAAPAPPSPEQTDQVADELPNPLEDKRRALREEAITGVLNGTATPQRRNGTTVVKVGEGPTPADAAEQTVKNARGPSASPQTRRDTRVQKPVRNQYVELEQERADKVFVILAEFGDRRHPDFPDVDTDPDTPGPDVFDGPAHNTIPEPDRTKDNSTIWQPDYDRAHYEDMYFDTGRGVESVKTYYRTQSSGRYTINGEVSDWVKVPFNQARYGRTYETTWNLIADALRTWVREQRQQGRSDAQIRQALAEYDQWDRYDYDGDGDFNESDGYIDHFQIVHAGSGEEDGSSRYGEDAIWSHRWFAFYTGAGTSGPEQNQLGGTEIGNTGIWVGDYTIQPENGGLSVFVHEYGHDLGLPDAYDTSGGGDNSNEYWTLMAQSRLNAVDEPLGTRAGDLGAWEKLQLGWLDYEAVQHDQSTRLRLGPQEYNSRQAQGAVVVLPDKQVERDNGAPASGESQFYSGSGDELSNSMTTRLDLSGASGATLTAQVRYDIEEGYDFAYLEASTDGESWEALPGTVDGEPIGEDTSGRPAIDGVQEDWATLETDLSAYAGQPAWFRVRYLTDGAVSPPGLFVDDIVVTADGEEIVADDAEGGATAWEFDGFSIVGAVSTDEFDNYYVMGHRSYVSYDRYLRTGPYNFGWSETRPDWVEHYSYGRGLLISYWDTSQSDNNTNEHPGVGRNLPIDAHPEPFINIVTGEPWRARHQVYDAPFSTLRTSSFTLHTNGKPSYIRAQPPQPLFDDTATYWYPELPNHGVKLPAVGVRAKVVRESGTAMTVQVN